MAPLIWLLESCLLAAAGEPVVVHNQGLGGNTTRDALHRYQRAVTDLAPDHLVILLGTNDACNSGKLVPLDEFRDNLAMLIDSAPTRSVVLVTPPPVIFEYLLERHPHHPAREHLAAHVAGYDAAVRQLAAERELTLVDFHARVMEVQPLDGADSLLRCEANGGGRDGVHPNAKGYRALAELVAAALADRIQPGETVVCLGDSITFGAHMKGAGTAHGETYPAWLALLLDRQLGLTEAERPDDPPQQATDSGAARARR